MAILFNGIDEALDLPDLSIAGDFTVCFRVFIVAHPSPSSGWATAMAWDNEPASPRLLCSLNTHKGTDQKTSGDLLINGTGTTFDPGTLLGTGQWYDVVFTRAGTTTNMYVNAVAWDTESNTAGSDAPISPQAVRLGCWGGSGAGDTFTNFFNGWVRDFAVINEVWTAGQRTEYGFGYSPDVVSDILDIEVYYPLEDDLVDVTGNYADATLFGTPTFGIPDPVCSSFAGSASTVGWGIRNQLVRDVNGRIWTSYNNTARTEIKARYSDDDGVTWSTEESVTTTTNDPSTLGISLNGEPVVVERDSQEIRTWRRIAGTWTSVATDFDTGLGGSESGMAIFQDPEGRWHLLYSDLGAGSTDRLRHLVNDDDLTGAWVSHVFPSFFSNGPFKMHQQASAAWDMDASGNIHMVGCGGDGTTNYALFYKKYTLATDTWAATEVIHTIGSTSDGLHKAGWNQISADKSGFPHIIAHYRDAVTAGVYQCFYSNRVSGSWIAMEQLSGVSTENRFGALGVNSDELPYVLVDSATDFGTAFSVKHFWRSIGGIWNAGVLAHPDDGEVRRIHDVLDFGWQLEGRTATGFLVRMLNEDTSHTIEVCSWDLSFEATPLVPTSAEGCAIATAQFSPGSTVSEWPFTVDLQFMPDWWWDDVDTADGTRGRIYSASGVRLAVNWIQFDSVLRTGKVRFKWHEDVTAVGTIEVCIQPPRAANTSVDPNNPFGQYAAYRSDCLGYLPLGAGSDFTRAQVNGTEKNGLVQGDVDGLIGKATDYNGTTHYVDFGLVGAWERPDAISWMALIKPDALGIDAKIFGKWDDNVSQNQYLFQTTSGDKMLTALRSSGTTVVTSATGFASGWFHYGSFWSRTIAAGLLEQVIDGVVDANTANLTAQLDARPSIPIWMGAGKDGVGHNAEFGGLLQEVWFYEENLGTDWGTFERLQVIDNETFWGTWVYASAFSTTLGPTTIAPTTVEPTTPGPTTPGPTTEAPTTSAPTTPVPGDPAGSPGSYRIVTNRTVFVGPLVRRRGDPLPLPE
jgi:hypothetical protein